MSQNTLYKFVIHDIFHKVPKKRLAQLGETKNRMIDHVMFTASKLSSKCDETKDIEPIIQTTVAENMKNAIHRNFGSGIMYYEDYYKEVLNQQLNPKKYIDNLLQKAKNIRNESQHCFKFGEKLTHNIIKSGFSASDGLDMFLNGPTYADCGSLVEAVYLKSVRDIIGKNKFDVLFGSRKSKLQIMPYVCFNPRSSIHRFINFVDPNLLDDVDISQLNLGDHICITGPSWFRHKHPASHWGCMHAVVTDFHDNMPLISGLGLDKPITIHETMQLMADISNSQPSDIDRELLNRSQTIERLMIEIKLESNHEKMQILLHEQENHSVEQIKKFGGFKILNKHACRLSSEIMYVLNQTEMTKGDYVMFSYFAKSVNLASNLFKSNPK